MIALLVESVLHKVNKTSMYQEESHTKKASTTAKTALGLSIGALGVELLGGMGVLKNVFNGGAGGVCPPNNSAIYEAEIRELNRLYAVRETTNQEMFGLYKSQIDADFALYKGQRDNKDELLGKINDVEKKVDMMAAIRPYQDALINCKIDTNALIGKYELAKADCRNIKGVVCFPATPTVTGQVSYPTGVYCPSATTTATP